MPKLSLADVIARHLADVTFPVTHPLSGHTGEVFAFALRHETGLLLYETGVGRGNERLDSYYQVFTALSRQRWKPTAIASTTFDSSSTLISLSTTATRGRLQLQYRVAPDLVRSLQVGEAVTIQAGRWAHVVASPTRAPL